MANYRGEKLHKVTCRWNHAGLWLLKLITIAHSNGSTLLKIPCNTAQSALRKHLWSKERSNSFKRLSILFTHQCMALCQCVLVCLFSFPIIGVYSYLCSLREGVTTFASGASVKVLLDSFFSVTNVLLPVSYIFRIKKFVNIQFKKSSQIKIYHLVILYPLWA